MSNLTQNTTELNAIKELINSLPDYIDPATAPIPSDAITALTDKGVTVPDGSDVSGLAALISAIESGGGAKIAYGTFTPSSDLSHYEVTHNLGVVPNFAAICAYTMTTYTTPIGLQLKNNGTAFIRTTGNYGYMYGINTYGIEETNPPSGVSSCYYVVAYAATETTIKFGNENHTANLLIKNAVAPYFYIIGYVEGLPESIKK